MNFSEAVSSVYSILSKIGVYRLGNGGLIDAELAAYDIGFSFLEARLDELKKERFAATASEQGLARFEELLGINPRPGPEQEDRRRLIHNRIKIPANGFTPSALREALRGGGIDCALAENIVGGELKILLNQVLDSSLTMSQIEYYIGQLMPAHANWIFDYGSINFNFLDGKDYTWDKWDGYDFSFDKADQGNESIFN